MIEVKFIDLIKGKNFGPIKIGDKKDFVIQTLGQPDGFSNPDFNPENYDAILYDRYEFNFRQDKLNSISNSHILNWASSWKFNRNFHYQNENFKVTSWFKKPWIDTQLKSIKKKLDQEKITYIETIFYDSVKLTVGKDLELLFSSQLSYHKEPDEWAKIDSKILNLRLCNFHLLDN
ncbi:hypothetical protein [Lacibacter sp.]|uniref:hypothetical protein n=1 Tax=Lacibacter sp. TaxID=1915409 RepID=UPI002B4B815D|nr:hypothetical protein [Lacibacter sp.]HLP38113.1 hypothetical protein [Lacibacter sp.]